MEKKQHSPLMQRTSARLRPEPGLRGCWEVCACGAGGGCTHGGSTGSLRSTASCGPGPCALVPDTCTASPPWLGGPAPVGRDPAAAPEARSDVPFHRPWVYWILGLCFVSRKQTEPLFEPTCGAIAPTGPCLASFCTGDDHTSASCPTPPGLKGGHSWTHTSRASCLPGDESGYSSSHQDRAHPRLCYKSARLCALILKTDLQETAAVSPVLMVCGISVRPFSALFWANY